MHGAIKSFIEKFLVGVDSASGWETALDVSAPWPAWVTLVLVIVVTLCVATVYLRERAYHWRPLGFRVPPPAVKIVLIVLRMASLAVLLFMLYEWTQVLYRIDRPDLVLMIDVSQSMSHIDQSDPDVSDLPIREGAAAGRLSRWEHVRSILLGDGAQRMRRLSEDYRLKVYLVGDFPRKLPGEFDPLCEALGRVAATDDVSRLGDGLRAVLEAQRGRSTAAIVLFSDGVVTDGMTLEDSANQVAAENIPLCLVGVGREQSPRDVLVSEVIVDEVVFVNDIVYFDANVLVQGYADIDAEMTLRQEGQAEVLAHKEFRIDSGDGAQRVRIPWKVTEAGRREYVIEVKPLDGETSKKNNKIQATVTARDDKIHVLFVQGYPNYEFRFLKSMMARAEGSIQLTTVLQDADYDYTSIEETARRSVPVSQDELFRYDVIILGDVEPSQLGDVVQEHLAEFVMKKGGGLVLIAGPKYLPDQYRGSPMASLFPMRMNTATLIQVGGVAESYQVRPTHLGLASASFQLGNDVLDSVKVWQDLPSLYWHLRASDWKPGIRVLAEHSHGSDADGRSLPLITMQYVGAGKVVFHAMDATWRWRYRVGDVFFARYWLQTIRYLSRSKLQGAARTIELTTDRQRYRSGEPVRFRVRFIDDRSAPAPDDGVAVAIEQRDGSHRRVTLQRSSNRRGIFRTAVTDLPPGSHHAFVVAPVFSEQAPSTDFSVAMIPGELSRLSVDVDAMRRSANVTRGNYYNLADSSGLFENLPTGHLVNIESTDRHTLWNTWQLAAAFVLLLTGEWLLRKKVGML